MIYASDELLQDHVGKCITRLKSHWFNLL